MKRVRHLEASLGANATRERCARAAHDASQRYKQPKIGMGRNGYVDTSKHARIQLRTLLRTSTTYVLNKYTKGGARTALHARLCWLKTTESAMRDPRDEPRENAAHCGLTLGNDHKYVQYHGAIVKTSTFSSAGAGERARLCNCRQARQARKHLSQFMQEFHRY